MQIDLSKISTITAIVMEGAMSEESLQILLNLPKPSRVCHKRVPDNLDNITIQQLHEIRQAIATNNSETIVKEFARVLLGVDPYKALSHRADHTLGFVFWAMREVVYVVKKYSIFFTNKCVETTQQKEA